MPTTKLHGSFPFNFLHLVLLTSNKATSIMVSESRAALTPAANFFQRESDYYA